MFLSLNCGLRVDTFQMRTVKQSVRGTARLSSETWWADFAWTGVELSHSSHKAYRKLLDQNDCAGTLAWMNKAHAHRAESDVPKQSLEKRLEAGYQAQVNRTVVMRRSRCSHERSTTARSVTPTTRPGALRCGIFAAQLLEPCPTGLPLCYKRSFATPPR